jgi:hypothetical protein
MTATDKQSLISESGMAIQISVHHAGKEPDRYVIRVAPGVSRMTTVREVPNKSKSGLYSRDEVLTPSNTWPDRHPSLPHSLSNKAH